MENEVTEKTEENANVVDNTQDYINTINEMKENSVSKEAYEKLKSDNAKLIKQLSMSNPEKVQVEVLPTKEDIQKLRNKLADEKLSNMEYVKTALELRDVVLKTTGHDCFTSFGKKNIKQEDKDSAEESARFYRDCLEKANGNEQLFNSLFAAGLYNENE